MSKPTKENVATVMDGLNQFYEHMTKTQSFNIKEFVDFMEPKFKAAGYRDEDKTIRGGNILILTEIGAGDFMATTGAIREIRRIYPDARITLSVHPRAYELAEICPYVNEIILDPQNFLLEGNPFELYKLNMETARKMLEQRFDICFAFAIHPHTPLLMYMSGAKVRVTYVSHPNLEKVKYNNLLIGHVLKLATHLFPCSTYGDHIADDAFSLIENLLHLPISNRKLELWHTPADVGVAKSKIKNLSTPIYSLNMGGAVPGNHYPPEKYAQLLELILRKERTATFIILGGGERDLKSAEIIKNSVPKIYEKNVIDLTNKVTYRQSAAILSLCNMHIGNDTGTMHIAAAVNCPVIELTCFPADLPMLHTDCPPHWHPYGVPSVVVQPAHTLPECKFPEFPNRHAYRGCAANFPHCITQIKPETIYRGFKLLKERAAKKLTEPLFIH